MVNIRPLCYGSQNIPHTVTARDETRRENNITRFSVKIYNEKAAKPIGKREVVIRSRSVPLDSAFRASSFYQPFMSSSERLADDLTRCLIIQLVNLLDFVKVHNPALPESLSNAPPAIEHQSIFQHHERHTTNDSSSPSIP
jgi:hypothetical protein